MEHSYDEPNESRIESEHPPVWRERARRGISVLRKIAPFTSGVLAALVALLVYNQIFPPAKPLTSRQVQDMAGAVMASATPPPSDASRVYAAVRPSLVLIQTKSPGKDANNPELALGSGVIIDDKGDILTCLHVVNGAQEILLTFADGTQSAGQVTNTQPEHDIAVLSAETPPAQIIPAVLGNPRAMNVGDEAFAIGNPFGLYSSLTSGVISGFDRSFKSPSSGQQMTDLIQIDAAVNPGNSGGPLVNRYGQVVGIVVGILNPVDQDFFVGIGFAVPINIAGGAAGSPQY